MPRELPKPGATIPDDVAGFIADALKETEELPRTQIAKVLKALGRDETLGLLHEVQRIEASGGMLLPDGSRRRTPGGVFFYLARPRLPRPLRYRIFAPPRPPTAEPAAVSPPQPEPRRPSPAVPGRTGRHIVEVEYLRRGPSTTTSSGSRHPPRTDVATKPLAPVPPATSRPPKASVAAPPVRAVTPANKKEFVLGFPHSTPATEVIEAARQQNLSISASYVYAVRKAHQQSEKPRKRNSTSKPTDQLTDTLRAALEPELAKLDDDARRRLLERMFDPAKK